MTLIIEDGSGKTDSESYVTGAEAVAILAQYDKDSDLTEVDHEPMLRLAHLIQETKWRPYLKGRIANSTQALLWPRVGVVVNDFLVSSDVIPEAVKKSMAFALWELERDGGALKLDVAQGGKISEVEIVDAVRVKFGEFYSLSGSGRRGEVSLFCDELMEAFAVGSLAGGLQQIEIARG